MRSKEGLFCLRKDKIFFQGKATKDKINKLMNKKEKVSFAQV